MFPALTIALGRSLPAKIKDLIQKGVKGLVPLENPDNLCAGCPQPGPLGLTTVKLSCQSVALLSQTCSHPRCPGFCRPPVWVDDNIDSLSGLMLASRRGEKHSLENPLLKSTLPTHAGIPLRSRYCSCSRVWI